MRKTFRWAGSAVGILLCLLFAGSGRAVTVDTTSPYSGTYFMAYNASVNSSIFPPSSGTMPTSASLLSAEEASPTPAAEIVEVHTDKDGNSIYRFELRDIMDIPENAQPAIQLFSLRGAAPEVGDEQEFKAYNYTTQETFDASFTLKYSGTHCNIWQKSDDPLQVTDEMAAELGAEFDVNIHDRMISAFGPIFDRDGDGKTAIFLYDIPDGYVAGSSSAYTAGFFLNGDMWRDDCNSMDALHIDTYPSIFSDSSGESWTLDTAKSTTAHELQHLIEASFCVTTGCKQLPVWVNEGLSMAAEHMIYGPQTGRIKDYNQVYQPGDPLMEWGGTLSNYSLSYLFFQYLRIQTQGFSGGGLEMFRQIIESEERTGRCVERGMRQFYPYITTDQLIRNFYIALTLREDSGLYGFGGEAAFRKDNLQVKLYSSTASKELHPGGAVINKMSSGSHTAYPSGAIRYAAFSAGGNGVDTPLADVPTGQVYQFQNVTLSCSEKYATLYYTLNGAEPNENSPVYDGRPVSIHTSNTTDLNVNITLKAIAITPDGRKSDVSSYQYTLRGEQVDSFRRTEGSADVNGYGAVEAIEKDGIVQVGSLARGAAGTGDLYDVAVPDGCSTIGYIAKYTHSGRQEWIRSFGGDKSTVLYDVTAVSDGYVASGYVEWSSSAHTGDFEELSLPGSSGQAAILVKFDILGNVRWIKTLSTSNSKACLYAVTACPDNDSVVAVGITDFTGYASWPNDFESFTNGSGKALAVKVDDQGDLLWNWASSASGCYSFRDVALLSDGTVVAAGSSGSNAIIYAFQGQNGNIKWSHVNKSNSATGFLGVTALSNDTVIAAGHSSQQGIIAAYSSSGSNSWTKAISNGSNNAQIYCVDVVPGDNGEFFTLLSFGLLPGYGGGQYIGSSGFLSGMPTVGYADCPAVVLCYNSAGTCIAKNGYSSRYSGETFFRYVSASLIPLGGRRFTVSGSTTGLSPLLSRTPHAFLLTFSDESDGAYYTVSGNVGLPGVAIGNTTSDSNGDFQLRVKDGDTVMLEPKLDGYTFAPSGPTSVGPVTDDSSGHDFTPSPVTYTLRGTVRDHTGKGLSGVLVGGTTTGADGTYAIKIRAGANALLEPTLSGKTFEPDRRTLTAVSENVSGLDFQVPKARYTVSGKVTRNGQPQGGVRIGSVLTGPDGTYSVTAEEGSSLTLTPAFLDYTSVPAQIVLTGLSGDKADQNFELGKVSSTLTLSPIKAEFAAVTVGYSSVEPLTFTVKNVKGDTCSGLTVSLPAKSNYEVSTLSVDTLAVGESATFTIKPKDGLAKGSYSETVTVQSGVLNLTATVTFQVEAASVENPDPVKPDPEKPNPNPGENRPSDSGTSSNESSSSSSSSSERPPSLPAPIPTHTAYLQGYPDGGFHPDEPMTRAQCTAMLSRLDPDFDPEKVSLSAPFPDTDPDLWYIPYISFARQKRLISGYQDGTFHPDEPITRAEFATVVRNALGLESNDADSFPDTATHWARYPIAQLVQAGILDGYPDGTFRPDAPISRSEAAKVLNRAYQRSLEDRPVGDAPSYSDLSESHWAYYEIWEASVEHPISQFHPETN